MRPSRETIGERSKTHGMTETPLYSVWCGMKNRCYNAHYKHYDRYGGRGISMCDEWKNSFESFRDWAFSVGYDNGNYCPENCRWVDFLTQQRNRGDTVYVIDGDKKIPARQFTEENKITNYVFVFRNAKKGKTASEILERWKYLHRKES